MIQYVRMCFTVAAWEFGRYFKLKDQVIGILLMLVGATIGYSVVSIAKTAGNVEIAVLNANADFALPAEGKISVAEGEWTEPQWREKVNSGDVDGLLIFGTTNPTSNPSPRPEETESKATEPEATLWQARLVVRRTPTWIDELQPVLQADRMRTVMTSMQVDPMVLASIMAPAEVEVVELAERPVSGSDRFVAYVLLGATLITSWIGLAYLMTGITGEKQQRVTEQIVSAIKPQMWIDGKLLGITGAAIGSLGFIAATSMVCGLVALIAGYEIPLPNALQRPELVPVFVLFYVGGVFFWNCFYAAVAATINDPNTSSRSPLLFLPMLPLSAAALVASQPNGWMMRILSVLPGTSVTAMPMRLVLGDVTWPELAISIVLLFVGIGLLRWFAARIFAAGIMLYGKEPTWIDIAKWACSRQTTSRAFAPSGDAKAGLISK